MKKINRNANRIVAVTIMICMLVMGAPGLITSNVWADTENDEDASTQDDVTTKIEKEEVVYVVSDATGNPTETISSIWLKNNTGSNNIEDVSDLRDIENTKGDETYTAGANDALIWNAEGSDIHYRGTTDKELPVKVSINYYLDGREVSSAELAGAEGHLKINVKYENLLTEKKTINGKEVIVAQPFAVVTGTILDSDKASNVTISDGKVVNAGGKIIVGGIAFPGLSDSLSLESVDIKSDLSGTLPDELTIEADVKDFSLETILTVIDNSILGSIDLDDVETLDELKDALSQLTDATTKLKDGAGELEDGVSQLNDGGAELASGIAELDDGAKSLASGANTLASGTDELNSGAKELASGSNDLTRGAGTLASGTDDLAAGSKSLSSGADALAQGNKSLADGAEELAQGAGTLADGNKELSEGAAKLRDGSEELNSGIKLLEQSVANLPDGANKLYNGTLLINAALKSDNGNSLYDGAAAIGSGAKAISAGLMSGDANNPGIYEAAYQIQAGSETISQGAAQIAAGISELESQIDSEINEALGTLYTMKETGGISEAGYLKAMAVFVTYQSKIESITGALDQIQAGANQIAYGAKSGSQENPGIYEAATGIMAGSKQLAAGADSIASGASQMETGIDTIVSDENLGAIIAGLSELSSSSETLVNGVSQLAAGSDSLTEGAKALADGSESAAKGAETLAAGADTLSAGAQSASEGADSLASGAKDLNDGVNTLNKGAYDLYDGAGTLANGAGTLANGTASLSDGANTLASGANTLSTGTGELRSGAGTLTEGIGTLLDGVKELREGIIKFDEEGIQKITGVFEDDAEELIDRLKAIQSFGNEYESFSGISDEMNGTVKFIIRTESIG